MFLRLTGRAYRTLACMHYLLVCQKGTNFFGPVVTKLAEIRYPASLAQAALAFPFAFLDLLALISAPKILRLSG